MRLNYVVILIMISVLLISVGCQKQAKLEVDYQKYTLENGLEVILHEDLSDPITSVAILYHVGSNREETGRTGFAHLFEHMLFQESQHVGQDQFFQKIQGAGGTLNGGTWEDGTVYFQIVPKNALEMVLWLESDRMGYLLPTVTPEAFKNQQEVVINEKRQRVDNQPYGHTGYVIGKLLYPETHPYNWQVIGSMEDLRNATLEDVHNFHKKWYSPNNATLVIAGDFDEAQTKEWIEKYFGELKSTPKQPDPTPMTVSLDETKRAYHEDNFAKSPELTMVYPAIQQFTEDAYALDFLAELLSDGKKAPLYKVIVEEKKLAPSVSAYFSGSELCGEFRVRIRAFPSSDLTEVENAVKEAFAKFETDKFTEKDLSRIKAQIETDFYNQITSIFGKSFQLAYYNEFAGSPGYITKDLENLLAVTSDDIWNVYNKYVKDKNYVLTSFVPKGKSELVAENSEKFPVVEESVDSVKELDLTESVAVEKLESKFDRTIQPPFGEDPKLKIPDIWTEELDNGIKMYGIVHDELPLIEFSITLKGGLLLDDMNKIGVANLMSDIMMEGTKNKTPVELEEAIDELGADINMYTTKESIVIQANMLSSKFDQVYALVQEILLEPRWDEKEFERIKSETIENINRRSADPGRVASNTFAKLIYGENHILAYDTYGTQETVESITMDDLKAFYNNYFSPAVAYVSIVGDISKEKTIGKFSELTGSWQTKLVDFPEYPQPQMPEKAQVYFVDFPDAKQSEIRIGHPALAYNDPDYYPAYVMNYKLGGSFNGFVNMILREEKGYTYGARTYFTGTSYKGPFTAAAAVQSNATMESIEIFRDEISKYREGIKEEYLEFTKNALIKSNARRFETLGALLGMLNNIARYELPLDYIEKREQIVRDMTLESHKELAQEYLHPDKMYYLVVGDAQTQLKQLKKLGMGKPIVIKN